MSARLSAVPVDPAAEGDLVARLRASITAVFRGNAAVVEHLLTAVLARGHVLIEDVPGVGKTTLAEALARALGCRFTRLQFTADLLPSDILGANIFDTGKGAFRFHPGPVFSHIVLADEINRTPPKTQSSLLEAMNERQVSVDGTVHVLPDPFLVLATQNPLEHHGTFPLPESQVDRFMMRLEVGYPDADSERLLLQAAGRDRATAEQVLGPEQVVELQDRAMGVSLHASIEDFVLAILKATRTTPGVALGASPRAGQALVAAARARAFLACRGFVVPDDVLAVAEPVLAHRLILARSPELGSAEPRHAEKVLGDILASVPVPR